MQGYAQVHTAEDDMTFGTAFPHDFESFSQSRTCIFNHAIHKAKYASKLDY